MVRIVTSSKDNDIIFVNDVFFNVKCSEYLFDERALRIVKAIDHAAVDVANFMITTPFGYGTVTNLSTGCKTVLNILNNSSKIFSIDECGENVMNEIFSLDTVTVYMSFPKKFKFRKGLQLPIDGTVVSCFSDYLKYWE